MLQIIVIAITAGAVAALVLPLAAGVCAFAMRVLREWWYR